VYEDLALPELFGPSMVCFSSSKYNISGKATVNSKIM
jgi:hypothetical protein